MIMKEQIRFNWAPSEIVFQLMHPATGAPLHNERVVAVPEEFILPLEIHMRDVTDGMQSLCKVPVDVVSKRCQEVITFAKNHVSKV